MWSDCIIGAIKKQSENIGHRKLALRVDNVYIDLVTTNQIICFTKSLTYLVFNFVQEDVWPTMG